MTERLTCNQPDREFPGLICGYPLPCPYHTAVIDLEKDPPTVTIPDLPANSLRLRKLAKLKLIAEVLKSEFKSGIDTETE